MVVVGQCVFAGHRPLVHDAHHVLAILDVIRGKRDGLLQRNPVVGCLAPHVVRDFLQVPVVVVNPLKLH